MIIRLPKMTPAPARSCADGDAGRLPLTGSFSTSCVLSPRNSHQQTFREAREVPETDLLPSSSRRLPFTPPWFWVEPVAITVVTSAGTSCRCLRSGNSASASVADTHDEKSLVADHALLANWSNSASVKTHCSPATAVLLRKRPSRPPRKRPSRPPRTRRRTQTTLPSACQRPPLRCAA